MNEENIDNTQEADFSARSDSLKPMKLDLSSVASGDPSTAEKLRNVSSSQ